MVYVWFNVAGVDKDYRCCVPSVRYFADEVEARRLFPVHAYDMSGVCYVVGSMVTMFGEHAVKDE